MARNNFVFDKWIIKRDKYGMFKSALCNGNPVLTEKCNIEYPLDELPILHLDIRLKDFNFETEKG